MITEIEKQYVLDTYNSIVTDFSRTRYNVWSVVKNFIVRLSHGLYIGNIGCCNGKNMYSDRHQFWGV